MKVITIKQPWATLIAEGYKEYEFRTWKTKYRGQILIHAGKGIDKKAMDRFKHLNLEYPIGKIIAKATITDCIKVTNEFRKVLKTKNLLVYKNAINNEDWDGYGFKLENVEKIDPIEVNGKLSLWEYDYKNN
ncbi:MAG: ASCH domain-containing protein [Bacilli bacterium]|nr:ASCH domain-containing protein [Bacilli bacterium]